VGSERQEIVRFPGVQREAELMLRRMTIRSRRIEKIRRVRERELEEKRLQF
jgi:hypothetical protein